MPIQPETAGWGSVLAFLYGTGLGIAFILTGLALVFLLGSIKSFKAIDGHRGTARVVCGLLVVILGLLNITGYMVEYKSLVLGLFTP